MTFSRRPVRTASALAILLATQHVVIGSPTLTYNTNTTRSGLTDVVSGTGSITVSNGALLTLGATSSPYYWDGGTPAGGQKTFWNVGDGGIRVTQDASINNNEAKGNIAPGIILNADTFMVYGNVGGNDYIEFDAGFNADRGTGPANVQGGFSTLRVTDTTLRTHSTQNLPSIWKHTADNQPASTYALTHHGLIILGVGNTSSPTVNASTTTRWEVRSNTQMYDGGINWGTDWTLDVASGLSLISDTTYEQTLGPHVSFGDQRNDDVGAKLTKTGAGKLLIARGGVQGYAPGAVLEIQQGSVEFNSNPTQTAPTFYTTSSAGQNLQVTVASGASVAFHSYTWPAATNWYNGSDTRVNNQHEIRSLASSGVLTLGGLSTYTPRGVDLNTPLAVPETAQSNDAFLEVLENVTLTSTSVLELYLAGEDASDDYRLRAGGTFAQAGELRILDAGLTVGVYDLFDATSFSGSFLLTLPEGMLGTYNSTTGVLSITAVPEPALAGLSLAAAAVGMRRRRMP